MRSIFKRLICLSLLLLAAPVLADGIPQERTVAQTPALFYAEATFASAPTLMQQAETVVELSQVQVENTRWSQVLWNGQEYFIPSDQLVPVLSPDGENVSLTSLLSGYSAQAGIRYVQLGAYAYETNGMTRPILWRILDTDGQTALLLSEMVLDAEPYLLEEAEDPQYELQWDLSHMKFYLDSVFLPQAFSAGEQALLSPTRMGKVFLLSATDYRNTRYGFQSGATVEDTARQAEATPYAKSKGAEERNGHATYWTCSLSAQSMQMVKTGGSLGAAREERTNVGVRVAVSLMLPGVQVSGGDGSLESPYLLQGW